MKTINSGSKQFCTTFLLLASTLLSHSAGAQQATTFTEQNKLIRAPNAVARLGTDLFGDKVNLYTGSLEFVQTDVSLPGNNALPVAVGRRIAAGEDAVSGTLFGRWDLDIPHLHGIFSTSKGWQTLNGTTARCSQFSAAPNVAYQGTSWAGTEYWRGSFLYVPGAGDQELLTRASTAQIPTGNASYSYPVATRNNWMIRCLPTMATGNGATGEAFVAISPDGTQYQFDWLVSRSATSLSKGSTAPDELVAAAQNDEAEEGSQRRGAASAAIGVGEQPAIAIGSAPLPRSEIWILPTRVTDRFGNTVTYTYDTTNKWQLKSIVASDGRSITLSYISGTTLVSSVFDGTRTWRYSYSRNDTLGQLQTVTLPDNSTWQLSGMANLLAGIDYLGAGSCEVPGMWSSQARTASLTHPSGAVGSFTITPTRHGRAGVFQDCRTSVYPEPSERTWYPKNFDTYALTSKTLSGAGLSAMTWQTQYPTAVSSWEPCNGCVATKTVAVTDPAGNVTRHTFGTLFRETEGQLLGTETVSANGETLQSTTMRYREAIAPLGYSQQPRGDGIMAARVMEVDRRDTGQQGVTFTWEALQFDGFARPTQVSRYSSLSYSRVENTEYENNLGKWILSQPRKVTEASTGKVMVQNQYDPTTSVLLNTSKFGKLQQSLTYNADGTLQTVKDGNNQVTTYSSYMRGIAQRIDYPDGTNERAVVNNIGKITSLTNEANTTTSLGYDTMGRLASVSYPAEAASGYNATSVTFSPVSTQEYDLAAGHWRQVVTTGNNTEISYLDALWRPVYTARWDTADQAGTFSLVKHRYDFAGRSVYDSYAKGSGQDVSSEGVYTAYDALGRTTGTSRTSELGQLSETFTYAAGFQKVHTDARGNAVSYAFQVFDEPSEDAISGIAMPEGANVSIGRDIFGKTTSITRYGNGTSATRSYVYDGYERLCKAIESETAATIQDYDGANNLAWRASGVELRDTSTCNTGDVPASKRISYTYDARNRLRDTSYGDASPAIYRTYTLDGLPNTIQSDGTQWTYEYNNRRLPTAETMNYGGVNYRIGRGYDTNGALSQLTYPDNTSVAYNPNALGQARQAGGYATGVSYHPNGAIRQFSYGNGIVHTLTQNVRGLPQVSQDGSVLSDRYTYDNNANVTAIADQAESVTSRGMEYDALDRLKHVNAPALWGDAWYSYDALDNLTYSYITGGSKARQLTHAYSPGTNRLDSIAGTYNIAYAYDSQGNVVNRGGQSYSFDIGNRMRGAPGVTTHTYDGLGRRVSVVGTDGVNRIYVYGQEGRLLYATVTGQPLASGTKYIYLNRHVVAEAGSGVVYDHTDGLGSPVAQTNVGGGLISRTRYEPYGATAAGSEPTIGFTGHLNAANLGLVDMQQRFYDPMVGVFLSVDPVITDANTGGSFNRYVYADNSPYRYIDPDGRDAMGWVHGGLTAASFCPSACGSAFSAVDGAVSLAQGDRVGAGIAFGAAAVGIVSDAGAAKLVAMGVKEVAASATAGVKLEKALASEAQTATILAGKGEVIAGAGTKVELKQAGQLAKNVGGKAEDWSKVSGGSHVAKDGTKIETHAFENKKIDTVTQMKTKLIDEGK